MKQLIVFMVLLGLGQSAFAADVTAITDSFTELATHVETIGGVMLAAVGAGVIFKWILGFII